MKAIRFLFSINDTLHREVKIRAAQRNISMGKWINQAIMARIANEQRYEEKHKEKE
jgi:predicted HicB family RNase H-like nuclease